MEKLGKLKVGFESTTVSNFKSKRHEGSGNELVDYSKAPCLGANQKARGLWERDWRKRVSRITCMRMLRTPPLFPPKSGKKTIFGSTFQIRLVARFFE